MIADLICVENKYCAKFVLGWSMTETLSCNFHIERENLPSTQLISKGAKGEAAF